MPDDIIDDVLRRMRPLLPLDQWHRMAYELRQTWGGSEVYIRKAPAEGKAHLIGGSLAAGLTLREAFEAAGVSRRHGFRLVSRHFR